MNLGMISSRQFWAHITRHLEKKFSSKKKEAKQQYSQSV